MTGDALEDLGVRVIRTAVGALYGAIIGLAGGVVGGAFAGWLWQPHDADRDTLLSADP